MTCIWPNCLCFLICDFSCERHAINCTYPIDIRRPPGRLMVSHTAKEGMDMANSDFPCTLPHHDFKVRDERNPDDFGQRCRLIETNPGQHVLTVRSKRGYQSVGQAPFAGVEAGVRWAQQQYLCAGMLGQH